jgi:hypothetical protein
MKRGKRQSQSPTPDEEGPQAQRSSRPLGDTIGQTSHQTATTITSLESRELANPATLRSDTILPVRGVTHALGDYTDASFPIALCNHINLRSHFQNPSLMHTADMTEPTASICDVISPSAMHIQILSALQAIQSIARIHRSHATVMRLETKALTDPHQVSNPVRMNTANATLTSPLDRTQRTSLRLAGA